MKGKFRLAAVFVSMFIVSAIVHLPAGWLVNYLPMPPQLRVTGVSGSIWQGQASQVYWQNQSFGALDWNIHLAALLTGRVEANTRFGRGSAMQLSGRGMIGYDFDGAYAKNLIVSLPARQLVAYSPQPVPVGVNGQIELSLKTYRYAEPWCQRATGSLVWSRASLTTPVSPLELGQVVAKLSCDNNNVTLKGQQETAQVSSSFAATLGSSYNYNVTSWFKPQAQFPSELAKWLDHLPEPDGQGRYHVNHAGRF